MGDRDATREAREMHDSYTAKKIVALVQEIEALRAEKKRLLEHFGYILDYSAGWDEKGCIGPKPPHSWETVARTALDIARHVVVCEQIP